MEQQSNQAQPNQAQNQTDPATKNNEGNGYVQLIAKLKDDILTVVTDLRERAMSLIRNNEATLLEIQDEMREAFESLNKRITHLEITVFQIPGAQSKVDEHGNPISESAPTPAHDKDGNPIESPTAPPTESQKPGEDS